MDDYVNRVWSKYATSTLTVTPFTDRPNTKYYGRVSGNVMNFTDSSGAVVTTFQKPDADSIFGCCKLLDAPNDLVRGPISRTLCAAYNRSTLLVNSNQPDTSSTAFYQDVVTNHYARKIHAQMAGGKAYAFAFDERQLRVTGDRQQSATGIHHARPARLKRAVKRPGGHRSARAAAPPPTGLALM
jgi:hypothetical protein